jgi:hypothetical protein
MTIRNKFRCLGLYCLLLLLAPAALAFECRFYSSVKPEDKVVMHQIWDLENTADRVIELNGIDKIDIGVGKMHGVAREPTDFTRDVLRPFFKREKHRELLVAHFHKPIMWTGPEEVKKTLTEFNDYISEFKYKRVLILGSHAFGMFVVYDSENEKPTLESEITH